MEEKTNALFLEAKEIVSGDIALLNIAENATQLILDNDIENSIEMLPYGSRSISEDYFRHTPPTEPEIEMAITKIEDEIMPLVRKIQALNLQLVSFDKKLSEVITYTTENNKSISVKEVEGIFSRLAAIITGRPASMDNLPTDNDFTSYILILREVMHHIKFDHIKILS